MNRFTMFLDYVRPSKAVRERIELLVAENLQGQHTHESWSRVRQWFDSQLSGRSLSPPSPLQGGCHDLLPVRARPVWENQVEIFPWLPRITPELVSTIRSEFLALREGGGQFQTYRNPKGSARGALPDPEGFGELAHDKGTWSVAYLTLPSMSFDNSPKCPATMSFLRSVPRLFDHALFSVLAPHSHIIPHCGPTNKKLRIHLPLVVPGGDTASCRLKVADTEVPLKQGVPLVFDDSFVHEAWNDTPHARAVLLFDVWHPDLSEPEIEFLELVQSAFEHHLQRQGMQDVAQKMPSRILNPYGIILAAKERPAPPAEVLWV